MPSEPPPPAKVDPPPPDEQPPLGLDNAWERLSGTGRGVVVLLAMALVIGASVGVGLLVGRDDGGGDAEQVVLAETASSVVTLEGPPEIEPVPEETETDLVPVPVPEETETDFVPVPVPEETETDLVPVPVPEETETELVPVPVPEGAQTVPGAEVPVPGGSPLPVPSGALFVFTPEQPGTDIGETTIVEESLLTWANDSGQFTLVDRASGATILESGSPGGAVPIEAGEYDLEVTESGNEWGIVITTR